MWARNIVCCVAGKTWAEVVGKQGAGGVFGAKGNEVTGD